MAEQIARDWKKIIYRGVESEELDYKAALNWQKLSRSGKAKFARHCLALANTKGGCIVVGVGEDASGQPSLFTGLTRQQAKSFDPTFIGNFINRFADPEIDFTIERPIIDGKQYAIFVIRRFSDIPHVCAYGLNAELQQGVFYIRTADAASRPAYRASEIHALMQRALRNQREILGRMIRGVLYENRNSPVHDPGSHFAEDRGNSKTFFMQRRKGTAKTPAIMIDLMVSPEDYSPGKFSLSEIRRAADGAVSLLSDMNFVTEQEMVDSYLSNTSLRSFSEKRSKLWQIFQTGMFHLLWVLPTPGNAIKYPELVNLFAEAINFFSSLYSELGYDEELLDINLKLEGTEGIALTGTPSATRRKPEKPDCVCMIPDIRISLQRTAADLASGRVDHAVRLIKEVCERFNLPDGRHRKLAELVKSCQS